jgi:hypothetical protein
LLENISVKFGTQRAKKGSMGSFINKAHSKTSTPNAALTLATAMEQGV